MTREFFNSRADVWDDTAAEKDSNKLERMAGLLKIGKGAVVLDVGTGTGVFLFYLMKKIGVSGKVIALDTAEKMLLKAKLKDFNGSVEYLCADVMAIPLENEIFDAVVCYSCLPHFPDKLKSMQEMKRILKKGGQVFICHTSSRQQINNIHHQIPAVQNDLLPDAIEMVILLKNAGFAEIVVEDKNDSYLAVARKPA